MCVYVRVRAPVCMCVHALALLCVYTCADKCVVTETSFVGGDGALLCPFITFQPLSAVLLSSILEKECRSADKNKS